ncbi:ABC transporter ATP-binding protein [Streptobacillus moniliformis]|uniref:ABC transporter related protein n=1 Tax=Streptobacillus moniliformis (strain ATCC 14647 / DSM 12112 / NCTC 10651 / 9901) TaxID=519441 RepID=D1AXD2_STRM9|nr:ABC transporter ATP-binding protein [Streptobacillus moniliformis]ACZ00958.1 ABC transporter related protein [Streptobacillus moniliformis DSM 12112]AVL42663.1 ABC transporter ATP-binding protein [Streptobacillus moniliformis]SQA13902.1 Aliphatic sulfonates import ATP-binding protein SsuB [Streptobacillus moniliformis]
MIKLEVKKLSVVLDGKNIIEDINFHVNSGELVSIIGLSGSGKTTIFNAVAGIVPINTGKILLNDVDVTGKSGKMSYMLQKDLLLPFKTVIENIALPLIIKGMDTKSAFRKVMDNLEFFGLTGLENKYPKELSGGQRQRVAFLRTYMFSDDMNLLDEPFSALDLITKSNIHKWYMDIRKKLNLTTLLITHDIDEAILLSNRIYILNIEKGVGKISKEIYINLGKRDNTTIEFIEFKKKILEELDKK